MNGTARTWDAWEVLSRAIDEYRRRARCTKREAIKKTLALAGERAGRSVTLQQLKGDPDLCDKTRIELSAQTVVIPERKLQRITYEREQPLRAEDAAREVIARHGPSINIMAYGGRLVRPALRERKGIESTVESLELVPHTTGTLGSALNQAAQFFRSKGATEIPTDPPEKLLNTLLENPDGIEGIEVRGIAQTPVLDRDGQLHAGPGWDSEVGLWINAPMIAVPAVATETMARAAFERLGDYLAEFPFITPVCRSVALALMMTAALRASLPHVPAFMVTKPSYGAGASTLCEVGHIILTGRRAPVVDASVDRAELKKELDTLQIAGRPAIVLDNLLDGAELRSAALSQILTQASRSPRILGRSESPEVENTQLVMANGVNPVVAADLVRRFLLCQLDPMLENPETRSFARPKLLADIERERVQILTDCFLINAAYRRSTRRVSGLEPFGNYENWAREVREPLVWLGMADPCESRKKLVAEDPEKKAFTDLLRAWRTLFGDRLVSVAKVLGESVFGAADDPDGQAYTPDQSASRETARERLRQVVEEKGSDRGGRPNSKVFTWFLKSKERRIAAGLRLERRGEDSDGVALWSVRPVDETELSGASISAAGSTVTPSVDGAIAAVAPEATEEPPAESATVDCETPEQAESVLAWCERRGRSGTSRGARVTVTVRGAADRDALFAQLQAEFG